MDWRLWLVYSHRWLGIAGCVLFVAWFVSGIVMMYARMPTLARLGSSRWVEAAARRGAEAGVFSQSFVPKSMELVEFQGARYWAAERAPSLAEADQY